MFGLWFCVAVAIPATVFLLCVAVAIPATVFLLCWCGPRRSCSCDVLQTQSTCSWFPAEERAERVADAITIEGRNEWICKFCSKANVWTRWCCRRCFSNIAAALQGRHKKAVFEKNRGWCSGHFPRVVKNENLMIKKRSFAGCGQRWSAQ